MNISAFTPQLDLQEAALLARFFGPNYRRHRKYIGASPIKGSLEKFCLYADHG